MSGVSRAAVLIVAVLGVAACGDGSSRVASDQLPMPTDTSRASTPSTDPDSPPVAIEQVAGPSEFYFVVDGPLVSNGPPWDCVAAGTPCDALDGNFGGTIEMLDGCIVVQGSDSPPEHKSVVVFRHGVTWDEATQTILGLEPEPVSIGDTVDVLAVSSAPPDAWAAGLGLPAVPEKVRECMGKVGADTIRYNTPWMQIGTAPVNTVPSFTTAPPAELPAPTDGIGGTAGA